MPRFMSALRFDGDAPGLIAKGEIDGQTWNLTWLEHRGPRVSFNADNDFAMVAPVTLGFSAAVAAVAGRTVVFGVAPADAVAVRADGYEVSTLGAHDCFIAIFDDDEIPERVVAVDRHGRASDAHALAPDRSDVVDVGRRITVEAVPITGDPSYEHIVARGTVGDASWTHSVAVSGESMHEYTDTRAPNGFGGGGGGFGPLQSPGPARVLRVRGAGGSSTGVQTLHGWADPRVVRIELRLDSGEVIEVPVVGRELGIATVLFAIGLPPTAEPAIIDGFDETDRLIGRTWPRLHFP